MGALRTPGGRQGRPGTARWSDSAPRSQRGAGPGVRGSADRELGCVRGPRRGHGPRGDFQELGGPTRKRDLGAPTERSEFCLTQARRPVPGPAGRGWPGPGGTAAGPRRPGSLAVASQHRRRVRGEGCVRAWRTLRGRGTTSGRQLVEGAVAWRRGGPAALPAGRALPFLVFHRFWEQTTRGTDQGPGECK